jgi:RimJ/RimL family protein N-acetyltransferase
MSIQVRPISAEDAAAFHACLNSVARERIHLGFVQAPPLEAVRSFVLSNIERDNPQFVAVKDGEVIGWCDVTPSTLTGFTHAGQLGMGVRIDLRRKGVGGRLLAATLRKAAAKGLERVELEVYASNRPAIALYEKAGFLPEGIKKKGRKLDGVYDDVVCMALWVADQEAGIK